MNKETYISELKSKLAGFDEELVNEIVSDYEEHFALGYAQGKSDDEIIDQLGTIDDLVQEISESYERSNTGDKKNKFEYKANFDFDFSSLNQLGEQLNKATESITKQVSNIVNNELNNAFGSTTNSDTPWDERLADKISDFFNALYANKEKEEKEFQSFEDPSENEVQEFKEENIKHVIVRNFNGEIGVSKGGSQGLRANYDCSGSLKEQLGYHMDFSFNGDTAVLTLKETDFLRRSNFHNTPYLRLDLEINDVSSLVFENCVSSNIEINDVELQKLSCELSSGDLSLSDVHAEELIFFSNSGNLNISDYHGNAADIKSTSGDIQFSDAHIHAIRIATVSGDVTVDDGNVERLGAVSTSGDISVNCADLIQFAAETVSGDVDASLSDNAEARIKTTSGDVDLSLHNDSRGFNVKFKTLSGDVDIDYNGNHIEGLKNGDYSFGDADIKLVVATVSGDIEIGE